MGKLLFVDKSKIYIQSFSNALKIYNYDITIEDDLILAKNLVEQNSYDFVILSLDEHISKEDEELLSAIEISKKTNHTKLIILSKDHDIEKRNIFFKQGVIEYFSKSTPLKLLVEDLNKLILTIELNKNRKIMVIDDSDFVRDTIEHFLINKNYEIITCESAIDAITILDELNAQIDLILVDAQMPAMSGIEFLEKIKQIQTYEKIPIIILTSNDDKEVYARAIRHGAVDFIRKPISLEEVSIKTNLHIEQSENTKLILKKANELNEYKRVLNESDIISKTDKNGVITYVNDKFCEISGFSREELIGKKHSLVKHEDTPKEVFRDLWRTIQAKKTYKNIIKNKKKNGEDYYVDATISPILDLNGNIVEIIGVRHDITNVMNPKKQLLDDVLNLKHPLLIFCQIANYNMLSEFYNQSMMQKFDQSLADKLCGLFPSSLSFKKSYILGNGLFAFLKNTEIDVTNIEIVLNKVNKDFNESDIIFSENKYNLDLIFSYSNIKENIYDDVSLGVKYALRNKVDVFYSSEFYKVSQLEAEKKLNMISVVKEALKEKGKVVSYYQPIIDNETQQISKYESLIRIIDNKGDVIAPFFFLDLAKKTGYYHDITLKVIENTKDFLKYTDKNITINLSASDIANLNIRNKLLDLISYENNKGRITYELLEDEEVDDFNVIQDFISLSKVIGQVKIAIDDFGSGYSNFERLLSFQPDILKIDGSLIKNINSDKFAKSIVEAIVLFAKKK